MRDLLLISIADVLMSVTSEQAVLLPDPENSPSWNFQSTQPSTATPDIAVEVAFDYPPVPARARKIFTSVDTWSIFQDGNDYWVKLHPPMHSPDLWLAHFDSAAEHVRFRCSESMRITSGGKTVLPNPVRYPLDQVLLMYHLARRGGLLLHGAGAEIGGRGCVFLGRSGAGKTTLVRQFAGLPLTTVLSDDRVILRPAARGFDAHGTPWPGEGGQAVNRKTPLETLFFLSQWPSNEIRPLHGREAVERLFPVASVPWYDKQALDPILETCERLVKTVPAYELRFVPTPEVGQMLLEFLGRRRPEGS